MPAITDYPLDLKQLSQDYEINMIQQALADSQYNQKKTAEKLSLTYHQLRVYLKKYNLLDSTAEENWSSAIRQPVICLRLFVFLAWQSSSNMHFSDSSL